VNVGTEAPDVRLMFSLFDAVAPPISPKLNVLATDIAVDMFEVPVNVKPVADCMLRAVSDAVVRTIDPVVPNARALVVVKLDTNNPVVSVKLLRSNVPPESDVAWVESVVKLLVRS